MRCTKSVMCCLGRINTNVELRSIAHPHLIFREISSCLSFNISSCQMSAILCHTLEHCSSNMSVRLPSISTTTRTTTWTAHLRVTQC